jgi:1-acyl-sn-glycerol-3-phosphate acyltransferase
MKWLKRPVDFVVTFLLWIFFGLIEPLLFALPYGLAWLFWRDRERAFQRLNYAYFRCFFWLVALLVPGLKMSIQREIRAIRSSVVVCNHVSYLDSILLVSALPRHKTIIKSGLLSVPFMGWAARRAGYIVATTEEGLLTNMFDQIEKLQDYLRSGGNLFVFPEGTRSPDGRLGIFKKGAFGIARRCRAPVEVLHVEGTNKLFPPGNCLFNTCVHNTIKLRKIRTLSIEEVTETVNSALLTEQVLTLYPLHK